MSPIEKLEAAIAKLEKLKAAARADVEVWVAYDDLGIWAIRTTNDSAIGIDFFREDAELIVTLHRTIDAQLAILRLELHMARTYGWPQFPFDERLAVLALADAILEEAS